LSNSNESPTQISSFIFLKSFLLGTSLLFLNHFVVSSGADSTGYEIYVNAFFKIILSLVLSLILQLFIHATEWRTCFIYISKGLTPVFAKATTRQARCAPTRIQNIINALAFLPLIVTTSALIHRMPSGTSRC
jgi:hypothetical protein